METPKITWSLGYTMNIGNFQSIRIDFGVTDNLREGETMQQGTKRVYDFVEKQLTEKVKEAQRDLKE